MTYHENNKEILLHALGTLQIIQEKMAEMVVTFKKLKLAPSNTTQVDFRNQIRDTQTEIDELKEDLSDSNFPPTLEEPTIVDLKDALREELLRKKRFLTSFEYELKSMDVSRPTQRKLDESLKLDIESAILVIGDQIHKAAKSKKSNSIEDLLKIKSKLEYRLNYPQAKSFIKNKENLNEVNLSEFSDRFLNEVDTELRKIGIEIPQFKKQILHCSIKNSDHVEIEERNLLWVAYPELKHVAHAALIRIQDVESFLSRTKRNTPKTTHSPILQSLIKDIKKKVISNIILSQTLEDTLSQAKEKSLSKQHVLDFTITEHINKLKEILENKNQELEAFQSEITAWLAEE